MDATAIRKADIVAAVNDLPEDATLEDAMERLMLLHKIQVGLQQAEAGASLTVDEVRARLPSRR